MTVHSEGYNHQCAMKAPSSDDSQFDLEIRTVENNPIFRGLLIIPASKRIHFS